MNAHTATQALFEGSTVRTVDPDYTYRLVHPEVSQVLQISPTYGTTIIDIGYFEKNHTIVKTVFELVVATTLTPGAALDALLQGRTLQHPDNPTYQLRMVTNSRKTRHLIAGTTTVHQELWDKIDPRDTTDILVEAKWIVWEETARAPTNNPRNNK